MNSSQFEDALDDTSFYKDDIIKKEVICHLYKEVFIKSKSQVMFLSIS